jgi:mono/diheme cytochrome c family protein
MPRISSSRWRIGLLVWAVVGLVACAPPNAELETGKVVYTQYCAACHGSNGEGQANWQYPNEAGVLPAPPHNDSGHTWHHSDAQLLTVIQEGRNAMPAFGSTITPAQQQAVLAYIKTFWSPEIQAAQANLNP